MKISTAVFGLYAAVMVSIVAGFASDAPLMKTQNDTVQYLFIQKSDGCRFEQEQGGPNVHLVFDGLSNQTTRFSDRPFRKDSHMKTATFMGDFTEYFAGDLPNAAIMFDLARKEMGPLLAAISPAKLMDGSGRAQAYAITQSTEQAENGPKLASLIGKFYENCVAFIDDVTIPGTPTSSTLEKAAMFPPSSLPTGCISFSTSDGSYEYEVCFEGDVTQTNTTDGDTKTIGMNATWDETTLSYSFEDGVHAVCGPTATSWNRLPNEWCDSAWTNWTRYHSLSAAETACASSSGCFSVNDFSCDGKTKFYLCREKSSWQTSTESSCIYEKPADLSSFEGWCVKTSANSGYDCLVNMKKKCPKDYPGDCRGYCDDAQGCEYILGGSSFFGSSSTTVNFLCSRTHYTPQIAEINDGGNASCHYDIMVAWSGVCGYPGSNFYLGTSSLPLEPLTVIAPLIKRPSTCLKTKGDAGMWIDRPDGWTHKFITSDPYLMICMGENATVTSLNTTTGVNTELGKYVGWTTSDNQTFTLEYRAAAALSEVKGCPKSDAYEVASDNCFCGKQENDQIPGLPWSIGRGPTCASFGCSLEEGKEECTNRCLNQTDCKSFSYIVGKNNKGYCFLYTSTCTSDCKGKGNFKSSPGYGTQSWNKNYATAKVHVFWINTAYNAKYTSPRLAKVRIPEAGRCYYDIDLIWNGNVPQTRAYAWCKQCLPLEKSSSKPENVSWETSTWCNLDYPLISVKDLLILNDGGPQVGNQLPIQRYNVTTAHAYKDGCYHSQPKNVDYCVPQVEYEEYVEKKKIVFTSGGENKGLQKCIGPANPNFNYPHVFGHYTTSCSSEQYEWVACK